MVDFITEYHSVTVLSCCCTLTSNMKMNHIPMLIAVVAAVLSVCCAQGDMMPTDRTPNCRELSMMRQYSFLECDDENPRQFEEEQCEPGDNRNGDMICYCVDSMTGDRTSGRTYNEDEFENVDCDSPNEDDDDRRDMCPDIDYLTRQCGSRECIRRPNDGERCPQCIMNCSVMDSCSQDSDCGDGERCITSGDLARPSCMDVRVPVNESCVPDDDDDDFEDDHDHDDDDDDDGDDHDDDDDDYDDDETAGFTASFDRRIELGERECYDDLVCRRVSLTSARCQERTGPCFENDRRPSESDSGPQLECDDDSGNFEVHQENDREHWCVFPGNGTEIRNTRRSRSMRLNCREIVFRDCRIMINGRQFTVEHGEEAINFNMTRNMCGLCRCNNGRFEFCSQVQCPYRRDDTDGTQPCNVDGRMVAHRGTYEDECNTCRCLNGDVQCTDRDCSDDEDDDDDDMDEDDAFAACRRMPRSPVCATNLRTYPNKCTALADGFERFEITPGACTRDVICERFPCMDGLRCFAVSASCARRSCMASDFRRCINTTELMCRTPNMTMEQPVCGANNRTYPSICQLIQLSNSRVRYMGPCNRSDCPDSPVCGTDGTTYRSICDLRLQPDVRLDYRGACMDAMNEENVRDFCARVRRRGRCANLQNCNARVRPTDGCCPVCGGGVSVDIDKDGLDTYSGEFENARSTSEIRRRMTESDIVRDDSDKCDVEAQFTSNGNIEMFYEAKQGSDASTCAMKARMTVNNINNLGLDDDDRGRRQTEEEGVDPIFNLVTVATVMEDSTPDDTGGGDGGAANIIATSYSLLFGLLIFTMLLL